LAAKQSTGGQDVTERGERVTPDEPVWGYYAHLSIYSFAAPLMRHRRVLDIGCGTGYGSYYLVEKGASSVHGIDISHRAIAYCRAHYKAPNLSFNVANAEALDTAALGPFEAVFASNTLEHVAGVDELLQRIAAMLPADGIVVIAVPPVNTPGQLEGNLQNPYHINNLPSHNWLRKLRRYFESVQGYRHWVVPAWAGDSNQPIDIARAPAETRIRETDFTFTPLSDAELTSQTDNITCLLVARGVRPKTLPREVGEDDFPDHWDIPGIERNVRDSYALTLGPFLQEWDGQLVRQVDRGRVEGIFVVERGFKRFFPEPADSALTQALLAAHASKGINRVAADAIPMGERQGAAAALQTQALQAQLDAIYASPAWRLISRYRKWLERGRQGSRFVRRLYDPIVNRVMGLVSRTSSRPVSQVRNGLGNKILGYTGGEGVNKLYYIDARGRRHLIPSEHHLQAYGLSLQDVTWVDKREIGRYKPASPVPLKWTLADWLSPPRDSSLKLREVATCGLTGVGVEFGAGTYPLPVPVDCDVQFADAVSASELRKRAYAGQGDDFVELSYVTGIESMEGIADGALDFIVACHVIEHTRNPILAFRRAYSKLKAGGSFVLVVPDKRRTFDKDRDVTPLDHLVLDYEHPLTERDTLHFVEFYSRAFVTPVESLYARVLDAIANGGDIHFHTWTYESFREMVDYLIAHVNHWRDVWSQPAVEDPDSNEFYYVLTK
jgi:2-polyprenyl-3-methyl-5-hydroxy-6-metoxy-1,4-benzoquinol methylase